jgi:N-acetylgalactosamine-N,N'-diacetylbacillosaminyl-diphospho-undecaprenol 4-alpha-N-acetylgalactosaminyltransferase
MRSSLVLASHHYDADDYIRTYDDFLAEVEGHRPAATNTDGYPVAQRAPTSGSAPHRHGGFHARIRSAESARRVMTVAKRPPSAGPSSPNIHFVLGSLGAGGAERVAVTMGQRPTAVHEVGMSLLCDVREYAWTGPIESLGVEVYSAQASPQRKLGSLLRGARRLRSRLRFERPEACVGFTTWPNLLGLAACPRDVRSVITVHAVESVAVRGRSAALVHAAIRRAYPRADAIIAVSEGIARDLEEHFGIDRERVRVVPNPIDVANIRERAKDATAPGASDLPKRPYLVHVGRHAEPKGLDSLLRIYAELRRQMPQAPQLVLVGTGPLTERLMQLADALGLAARSSDNATSRRSLSGRPFCYPIVSQARGRSL